MAADLPPGPAPYYAAPIVVPVFTWTGCYIGGTGGYAFGNTSDTWGANPGGFPGVAGSLGVSSSFNTSGATGGVEGGCNYQVNPWFVFGIEADWEATSQSISSTGTVVNAAGSYPLHPELQQPLALDYSGAGRLCRGPLAPLRDGRRRVRKCELDGQLALPDRERSSTPRKARRRRAGPSVPASNGRWPSIGWCGRSISYVDLPGPDLHSGEQQLSRSLSSPPPTRTCMKTSSGQA